MKVQSDQPVKKKTSLGTLRIVSEEIDKMQLDMMQSLAQLEVEDGDSSVKPATEVKLARSRRETRILFVFKGSLEDTDPRLKKVYQSVTGKDVPIESE